MLEFLRECDENNIYSYAMDVQLSEEELMYYIMGQHSKKRYFKKVKYIGFYNPRLNVVYKYDTANLSIDLIKEIEKDIIGYNV